MAFLWGAAVMLQLPPVLSPLRPAGRQELLIEEGYSLSLGQHGWCLQPTEFWKTLQKKKPNAQKPRLNKACSGRAVVWGPREPDGAEGVGVAWLLSYRPASASPPGR